MPLFQLTLGLALPLSWHPALHTTWHLTWAGGITLAVFSVAQFVAYLSWDFGMRKGNVIALSLFADFIPWISLAATNLLVKVPIGTTTAVSAVTLVVGAMLTRYGTLTALRKESEELE